MNNRRRCILGFAIAVTLTGCAHDRPRVVIELPSEPVVGERAIPPAGPSKVPQGKPPAHAKAHGLRRQFAYYYYPSHQVYYAPDREFYFWIEGEDWMFGVELPGRIVLDIKDAVYIEIGTETPYEMHDEVRKRHKPKKRRGQGRGRGPWD